MSQSVVGSRRVSYIKFLNMEQNRVTVCVLRKVVDDNNSRYLNSGPEGGEIKM